MMLQNYWNSACRNLLKRKGFSFINILGLSIGLAASLLILTYVMFEFSFDKMHTDSDRIFRVESTFHEGAELTDSWASSSFGYGVAMKDNLIGIENITCVGSLLQPEQMVKFENLHFRENKIAYADKEFFKMFDFILIKGDRNKCLSTPGKVVITERIAKKYFKDADPLGKILIFSTTSESLACEVTGVMEEMPSNSHVHYNFLISLRSLPENLQNYWYKHEAYTYVLLNSVEQKEQIEADFPIMAEKYKTEDALKNKTWGVRLVPLEDIHLRPQLSYEAETKGNRSAMLALIFAAVAILIIAWINYINLTVARSMERAKEVGVRRVIGAYRKQLIGQFLFESLLTNLIAFIIAIGLIEILLPLFNAQVGREVSFSIWLSGYWLVLLIVCLLLGIFISGYYPALILLNRKPIKLLKGRFSHSRSGEFTRKALVVIQYTASMVLLCSTLVVFSQLSFMRNQSLGIKTDQILAIKYPAYTEGLDAKVKAFRNEVQRLPFVSTATLSGAVPGEEVAMFLSNHRTNDITKQNRLYEMLTCDEYFIKAYGMKIVAGRGFAEDFGDDVNKLVINEASVRALGYTSNEQAIGDLVNIETLHTPMQIIGVIKDFHQQALTKSYTPIMLIHKDKIDWLPQRYISAVVTGGNAAENLSTIKSLWDRYFSDSSYDYFFLDQYFEHQYRQDQVFGMMMGAFTVLAIFISCLGLWVLVMFACATRTKEMGIRKVLGASRWDLFYELAKDFLLLIFIATIIALPISWFSMNEWLEHYAFRIQQQWWFYIAPVALLFLISLLTIAWQTVKTIRSKPAKSLRYE